MAKADRGRKPRFKPGQSQSAPSDNGTSDGGPHARPPRRAFWLAALLALAAFFVLYGLLAYIVLPLTWTHYEHQKGRSGFTMVTRTAQDIPGDPINVGLVGTKDDVLCAMHAAAWYPADPITFRSSAEIVGSVVLDRPYRDAPVSKTGGKIWPSKSPTGRAPTAANTCGSGRF